MAWTEEEVLINKKNMLIAEFMGAEILSKESKFSYVQYPMDVWVTDIGAHKETYKQKLHSKKLEYHESWNWLMPVIEKIESIIFENDEYYNFNILGGCYVIVISSHGNELITSDTGQSKLECAYYAVTEFIKWYNDKRRKDS